jgi:hypothetical protein
LAPSKYNMRSSPVVPPEAMPHAVPFASVTSSVPVAIAVVGIGVVACVHVVKLGGAVTVSVVLPCTAGTSTLVARILVVPGCSAVTRPVLLTVATATLLLDHVTDASAPTSASTVLVI